MDRGSAKQGKLKMQFHPAGFEQLYMGVGQDGGCGAAGGEQADEGMDRGSGKAREAQDCSFEEQHLSNFTWGLGKMVGAGQLEVSKPMKEWIEAAAKQGKLKIAGFEEQHLSNFTWGLGTMVGAGQLEVSKPMKEWIEAAAKQGKLKIAGFKEQGLSNFTWG